MEKIIEHGWGIGKYSGDICIVTDDNNGHHFQKVHVTRSRLTLLGDHWEIPVPGTRGMKILCGRYAAGWNPAINDYEHPARLKFQEMCADHCWIELLARDAVKGHGYETVGRETCTSSKKS